MGTDKPPFYSAWVSTSGRVSLRWGPPCDTAAEARTIGRVKVVEGQASVSFVVRFAGGKKTPLSGYTHPASAKKIIEHWESLWDATETGVAGD